MYKQGLSRWLKHLDFIILDILSLELAYIIAYMCRHGWRSPYETGIYERLAIMIIVLDICVVFFIDSYRDIIKRGYLVEILAIIKHNTYILIALMSYLFFTKQSAQYSRIVFFFMWGFGCVIMMLMRCTWKQLIRLRMAKRKNLRNMLVITEQSMAEATLRGLKKQLYREYLVVGVVLTDCSMCGKSVDKIPVVASREDFVSYVKNHIIDEVFINVSEKEQDVEQWMNQFINMGVVVHINLVQFGETMPHTKIEEFGSYTVLSAGMKFVTSGEIFLKRMMDIVGAGIGLCATGILFCVFAPIIYVQSPGPIFFSQNRVGRNGRIFRIYKFRSMYPDAEERKKELMQKNKMDGLMFKMDEDPRVIPIGKFMRRTSLDEFPQFLNVLKGEMSLVGTRPPTVDEYKQYEMHHKKRLATKPGLTGMWQVSGRSNIVDFDEVVALDAKYISEWSLSLDVKLLFKTIKTVLSSDGAV